MKTKLAVFNNKSRGYYLVVNDNRYFICSNINSNLLEKVCNKYLSNKNGFNYWIDYYYGEDVHGYDAWMNLDCSDSFI